MRIIGILIGVVDFGPGLALGSAHAAGFYGFHHRALDLRLVHNGRLAHR